MKKHISKKTFCSIYTNRTLSFKEKYFQTFYITKRNNKWYIEQKIKKPYLLLILITLPFAFIPAFIIGGINGVKELRQDINFKAWMNGVTRYDEVNPNTEQDAKLLSSINLK